MTKKFLLISALAALLLPSAVFATSSTSTVSGPRVTKGLHNIESRFGFEGRQGDDSIRFRQHYDYGFSDSYALRLITQQRKSESASFDYLSTTLENRFQFFEKNIHGWEGGIRLGYTHRDGHGTADEVSFLATADIPLGSNLTLRHNSALGHEVGGHSQSGVKLAIRHRLAVKLPKSWGFENFKIGPELYHDFGNLRHQNGYSNQDHQLGAFLSGRMTDNCYYLTTYRQGISKAAIDNLFKFTLGYKF